MICYESKRKQTIDGRTTQFEQCNYYSSVACNNSRFLLQI